MSTMTAITLPTCPRCDGEHTIHVELPVPPGQSVNVRCPSVKRLWRYTEFVLDLRANLAHVGPEQEEHTKAQLAAELGELQIEEKFARWKEATTPGMWLVEEYVWHYWEVRRAYAAGHMFCAAAGAVSLVERVLNQLVFGLLSHYPESDHYKGFYRKATEGGKSEQNWHKLICALSDWAVLSEEQAEIARRLSKLRNDVVHYVPGYDFTKAARQSVTDAACFVDSIFNVLDRKDIFRLFEIPGEIWVREDMMSAPFVKVFVAPSCTPWASRGHNPDGVYTETDAVTDDFTEAAFIEDRKRYKPTHTDAATREVEIVKVQAGDATLSVRII